MTKSQTDDRHDDMCPIQKEVAGPWRTSDCDWSRGVNLKRQYISIRRPVKTARFTARLLQFYASLINLSVLYSRLRPGILRLLLHGTSNYT